MTQTQPIGVPSEKGKGKMALIFLPPGMRQLACGCIAGEAFDHCPLHDGEIIGGRVKVILI